MDKQKQLIEKQIEEIGQLQSQTIEQLKGEINKMFLPKFKELQYGHGYDTAYEKVLKEKQDYFKKEEIKVLKLCGDKQRILKNELTEINNMQ